MNRRMLGAAAVGLAIGATAFAVYAWNTARQRRAEAERLIAEGEDFLRQDLEKAPDAGDRGLQDRAIAKFRGAIEMRPDSSRAHRGLARAHLRRTEFTKAIDEYEIALRDPGAPGSWHREAGLAHLNRFRTSRGEDDLAAGVRRYEEAIAKDPKDAEALWGAGAFGHLAGDRERRDEKWNRLLAEIPESPWAARVRADLNLPRPGVGPLDSTSTDPRPRDR